MKEREHASTQVAWTRGPSAGVRARTPAWSRPGLQALALFGLFAADALVAYALGGPAWLSGLYLLAGAAFATVCFSWPRPRAAGAATAGSVPAQPAPARSAGKTSGAGATKPPRATAPPRLAVGYVRVPADSSRSVLAAPRSLITEHAKAEGLEVITVVHDIERPPGESDGRPALRWALERIALGEAQVLIVARLEHLSDTVADLSPLMRWFTVDGRALMAVDLRLDTSTEVGRLAAAALDGVGGWERKRLAAETSAARPAARRVGSGRASVADRPQLQQRIVAMREQGMTLQAIADRLNAENVPTVRGGAMWRPSSVQRAAGYERPRGRGRGIESPRTRPQ